MEMKRCAADSLISALLDRNEFIPGTITSELGVCDSK